MREGLGSPHLDSRRARHAAARICSARWPRRRCRRSVSDLRVRARGARARHRAAQRRADPRPAPAQGRAPQRPPARRRLPARELARRGRGTSVRYAPGAAPRSLPRSPPSSPARTRRARAAAARHRRGRAAALLARGAARRAAGREVVVLWGERLTAGPERRAPARGAAARSRDAADRATRGARGCWRFPPARTGAACARRECCRTPGPASPRSTPSGPRRARDRRGPGRTASCARSTSSASTRCAICPDRELWERGARRAPAP